MVIIRHSVEQRIPECLLQSVLIVPGCPHVQLPSVHYLQLRTDLIADIVCPFAVWPPRAEVDIYWGLETETDYKITKGTGWLEIMGCGMVDPNVLKNANIDPEIYSGYAFGMGIERIAMLLYQIPDIRMFYENDVRFLEQFKSVL